MRGRLKDLTLNRDGSQNITVTVTGTDFRETYDSLQGKELDVEIKAHREKRSRSANAYFHVLVNKIAMETGEADEAVKRRLVMEYGVVDRDDEGLVIGFKLPASVNVEKIYPYTRLFDIREEGGKMFNCYLVLKQTHEMDSKEMARVIDGAIAEAKELGIETDTPQQIEEMKKIWAAYETAHKKGD